MEPLALDFWVGFFTGMSVAAALIAFVGFFLRDFRIEITRVPR